MAHRGYPGEGPMNTNIRIRSINIGGGDHTKIRDIYQDSKTHKYDILLIQETKSKTNEVATALAGMAPCVFEAHNPDNHNKGGVAIIIINPTINASLVKTKHWNRYQVNRVESVSGATGSALEKTRIDAMQYIETRPNTRFKKNIGA